MTFVFLECVNESCRFRFPASAEEAEAAVCPRCRGRDFAATPALGDRPPPAPPATGPELVALLDNIRSIHNVGSMFRTADGAGLAHLYLAGITATPAHPKLAKAALGAHETVPWSYFANGVEAAAELRRRGYRLWALERLQSADADTPPHPPLSGKLALVVGNERAGVDPGILAQCDAVLSLPMTGHKFSLNAAVAFGIGVYYLRFGM